MKEIGKVLLGLCALCGLVALYGPESNVKDFSDWKYAIRMVSGALFIVALIWALIDLWGSDQTSDSKLYWTVLGVLFSPFALPVYFYFQMIKTRNSNKTRDQISGTRGSSD